jgi:hypothetical protein
MGMRSETTMQRPAGRPAGGGTEKRGSGTAEMDAVVLNQGPWDSRFGIAAVRRHEAHARTQRFPKLQVVCHEAEIRAKA